MAALGLRCCVRAFSSCGKRGLLFVVVCGLLIAVACCGARAPSVRASVVVARGLSSGSWALEHRLSSCGAWAQLLHDMWDLPRPGLEPVSPALAGGFLTTVPQGKPHVIIFCHISISSVTLVQATTCCNKHLCTILNDVCRSR